jgi:hypothetical protein
MSHHCAITENSVSVLDSPRAPADQDQGSRIGSRITTPPKATVGPSAGLVSAERACGDSAHIEPRDGGLRFEFRRRGVEPWWRGRWVLGIEAEQRRQMERQRQAQAVRAVEVADPHHEPTGRLLEAWAPVEDELRQTVDPETFAIWLADMHPHRLIKGEWVLACRPQTRGWVEARFGRLIASCAGRPVVLVNCENNQRRTL